MPIGENMYDVFDNETLSNNCVINWASLVNCLINSPWFGLVETEQFVANELYFITLCRHRLCDLYMQQWFGIISQRSSCILYKDLHVSFSFSQYLNITIALKHRVALTQFRTKT